MASIEQKSYKLKNGKDVLIRAAQPSDAEAFLILARSIMSEEIYSLTQLSEFKETVEKEQAWLKSDLENPNHLILVAECDGQLIGQLDFSNGHRMLNAHTGEFGMGVHKDYREQGLGSLLLKSLIDWAKTHPVIEKINLSVHHTNERAIYTYQKIGFKKEGLRTRDLKYPDNVYVDTVIMGLQIKP